MLRWWIGRFFLNTATRGVDESEVAPRAKRAFVIGTATVMVGLAILLLFLAVKTESFMFGFFALFLIAFAVRGVIFYLKNK